MVIETLHLGITRNCTLYCEHCFRGEKEIVNMSTETLENLFENVSQVNFLLLTGGEPFIAINQLEKLVELIKKNKILIGEIRIITNGTVMSARLLKVLKDLSETTKLSIKVSVDIFHYLELKRLNLLELRNKNLAILKEYFGATEYSDENQKAYERELNFRQPFQRIVSSGRAKKLSQKRLNKINKLVPIKYVKNSNYETLNNFGKFVELSNDVINGTLTIDVNGNIVNYGSEYQIEDKDAQEIRANINELGLKDAVLQYINYQNNHCTEEQKKLNRLLKNK